MIDYVIDYLSFSTNHINRSILSEKNTIMIDSSNNSFTVSKKQNLVKLPKDSSPQNIPEDSPIPQFNKQNVVIDKDGNECTVLQYHAGDDILKGIDLEKSIGSPIMKRLQYKVDKESVNV